MLNGGRYPRDYPKYETTDVRPIIYYFHGTGTQVFSLEKDAKETLYVGTLFL
jgi:hypothetical protein